MVHLVILIVISLMVVGGLTLVLIRFLKKLNKIEEARWGGKKDSEESLLASIKKRFKKKRA